MTERTNIIPHTESPRIALELSVEAIESTKHNILLCEQLVQEVLEENIDFGIIPGVPQPFLWDSGAAKIMAAFNCYAEYSTVRVIDLPGKITFTVYSKLISRSTQQVIATGIGASSTRETKHRYRWVDNPEKDGISRKSCKTRKDGKFRIPNQDTEDLLNIIAKMAAKRADVDAAQSLPGVASTLRKLFHEPPAKKSKPSTRGQTAGASTKSTTESEEKTDNWSWFWAKIKAIGITQSEARDILGINSIKDDWVTLQKRTLDEAYQIIKDASDLIKAGKEVDLEWEKLQHTSDTKTKQEKLSPE